MDKNKFVDNYNQGLDFMDILSRILAIICIVGFYVGWLIMGTLGEIALVTVLYFIVGFCVLYALYGDNPTL